MGVRRQRDRAVVELDRLVELVASACEPAGARQPVHGTRTDAIELVGLVAPDEIRVLVLGRLGVVVREGGRPLVGAVSGEPVRERACSRPRRAFGIELYATSRVSACLITSSRSSLGTEERTAVTRSRSSSTPKSGSLAPEQMHDQQQARRPVP